MTNTTKLFALLATCVISAVSAPALALGGAGTQAANAENAAASRLLTVAGRGEVMLKPDSLRTSISIQARAATLAQARAEAGSKTRAVIAALEGLGIQALQVRTVEIAVTPIPERQRPGDDTPPRIIGYEAESRLSVALRDVTVKELRAHGSRILDTALAAGANVVGGVDFFLSKPREAHRLALAAAVRDAQENAKVVAGAANVTMSGLRTIKTAAAESYGYAQQAMKADVVETVNGFPVEPGEIRVTTQVTASFLFTK
ncbi:SIMPL domain-containing protein [Sorangium sp. So ce362]|uniref:SIMPL domain-containing protein n=1 Tax=Sorangium sp. So ce362 TaxID=3133303 RepID=UPI003F62AB00